MERLDYIAEADHLASNIMRRGAKPKTNIHNMIRISHCAGRRPFSRHVWVLMSSA